MEEDLVILVDPKQRSKTRVCRLCLIDISHRHHRASFCGITCTKSYGLLEVHRKNVIKSHKKYPTLGPDNIECKICSFRGADLKEHIKHVHNINVDEYKKKYSVERTICENLREKFSLQKRGANNPGYQHGGKLSPFSKNFVSYNELSEKEKTDTISALGKQGQINRKDNNNCPFNIEYYLKRNFTLEESIILLNKKQFQNTFSLQKCIEKYGKEEGIKRFEARQIKWQKSLHEGKTVEEIERFHASKKGNGIKHHRFFTSQFFRKNPNKAKTQAIVYYVKCFNEEKVFWKVGITTKSIDDRLFNKTLFKLKHKLDREDKIIFAGDLFNCYKIEQDLLQKFNDKRIRIDYNDFQTYEAFSEDVLDNEVSNTIITSCGISTLESFFV